ncbi:MAG: hypothetical protein ACD_16C00169G0002 [uncultured bacterium]|nr:MAG: hypothetical protein ACD_16C00169G0002 [uncultured bacterium]OFW68727.1 MAG: hypothetical protein A2X70_03280 [Alphaproteobacteria bacterium GWC2_42_16]OFW73357.1 MAG: hypothetical protein A2Z80_02420 [Alphaproteobacteria bacterium GWA2_41_27]OFW81818.1 MAG: hypothetical protein A3E50_02165 [Alphaproteobacteria bacterium RIFCSPHIGHO2_12_FULL_42_100]OFW85719.1 MAG: hypothetical protein A2W06_04205 [Alphaproteobacteria bacterium RBG_16_42_14]OFW90863.1 MAG: hypothetical protein A3C41_036
MLNRFLFMAGSCILLFYGGKLLWQKNAFPPLSVMEVTYAHKQHLEGKGATVAVLDEGFDSDHHALKSQLSPYRYNTSNERRDVSESVIFEQGKYIFESHGTHVAGIIAKVAPNAEVIPIKVMGFEGDQTFVKALQIATKSHAHVVNISLRLSHTGQSLSPNVYNALIDLAQSGKLIVIAAGNEGIPLMGNAYTASLVELAHDPKIKGCLILAGASSYKEGTETLANFSNYPGNNLAAQRFFITAPGEDILSTITGGRFGEKSGTSMATPMVVGALCLLKEAFPNLPPELIANLLLTSARKVSLEGIPLVSTTFGQGLVNLEAALLQGRNTSHISRGPLL